MKLRIRLIIVLIFGLLGHSIASAEGANSHVDAERIISAGGSITEILFALGLGDKLVAVDTSSFYPEEATKLPKVGYFRSLAAEGIMSLSPDLIVAARGAGPEVVLEQIKGLGVELVTYEQHNYTLDAWKELILDIGSDFNREQQAIALTQRVIKQLELLVEKKNYSANLNAVALLSIGQRGPVAAGLNTVPDLLFELAGINNVSKGVEGYKPFSSELLAGQKVDLVFVPSHVIDGLGGEQAVCENQIIKLATNNECNLFVMDGLLLMGLGARLDIAVAQVAKHAASL